MYLSVVRICDRLNYPIPILLVIVNVSAQSCDYCFVIPLSCTAFSRMIRCFRQLVDTKEAEKIVKELAHELQCDIG